jgi:ribonuclease P protein component
LTLAADPHNGASNKAAASGAAFSFRFVFEGMSDEAHLSAEQPGPRTASRFPGSHGNRRWPRSDPGAPRTRSQEAVRLITLNKRSDFLAANSGRRAAFGGLVLLVRDRQDENPQKRVGYTVTKKVGNAVIRNRVKRRFRELAREILTERGIAGADHVLIGRNSAVDRDFDKLRNDLNRALAKVAE